MNVHVGLRVVGVRVVVLPGREAAMTRLCTNLPRTPFSLDLGGRLYRFRWQIERCFKEGTSYANLHQFDTKNVHIAEGLIWASLCAAVLKRFRAYAAQRVEGTAMSTRRVAIARITSPPPSSPPCSSASVFARLSVGVSSTCSRTLAAPTRIVIVAPAAHGSDLASRSPLK